jgi:hypothetical protein
MDGLAAKPSRLVIEKGSLRRDDGHESGSNEVGGYGLHVFVGGGRFLVEQVALFADDAAIRCATCDGYACVVGSKAELDVLVVRPVLGAGFLKLQKQPLMEFRKGMPFAILCFRFKGSTNWLAQMEQTEFVTQLNRMPYQKGERYSSHIGGLLVFERLTIQPLDCGLVKCRLALRFA